MHCPICGKRMRDWHRCSAAALRAIDAANTRAADAELYGPRPEPSRRTWAERLSEGFALMNSVEPIRPGDDS